MMSCRGGCCGRDSKDAPGPSAGISAILPEWQTPPSPLSPLIHPTKPRVMQSHPSRVCKKTRCGRVPLPMLLGSALVLLAAASRNDIQYQAEVYCAACRTFRLLSHFTQVHRLTQASIVATASCANRLRPAAFSHHPAYLGRPEAHKCRLSTKNFDLL